MNLRQPCLFLLVASAVTACGSKTDGILSHNQFYVCTTTQVAEEAPAIHFIGQKHLLRFNKGSPEKAFLSGVLEETEIELTLESKKNLDDRATLVKFKNERPSFEASTLLSVDLITGEAYLLWKVKDEIYTQIYAVCERRKEPAIGL